MILDFYHNKIVNDTISDGFIASFKRSLLPEISAKYGEAFRGIQMYEDFLSENLVKDGFAYYPLTVILDGGFEVLFVKWSIADGASFCGGVPYAYVGTDGLELEIAENVPNEFLSVTCGRRMYFDGSVLPIHINTVIDSVKLSGKYSQTFIDAMADGVFAEIEKSMAVRGLEKTGIRLEIPFAPETYMEHTSENVTYRRLLISDKASAAKDLWIKWTRLNSSVGYSVSDAVGEGEVSFELGEDVSQKVREKEYRFLTRASAAKYQAAMGRKNVTEWRELIKRAIRRGELEKLPAPTENTELSGEVNDKLDEILEKMGYASPKHTPEPAPAVNSDDELLNALLAAERTVMGREGDDADEPLSFMPEGMSLEIEAAAADDDGELPWDTDDSPSPEIELVDVEAEECEASEIAEEEDEDDENESEDELELLDELPEEEKVTLDDVLRLYGDEMKADSDGEDKTVDEAPEAVGISEIPEAPKITARRIDDSDEASADDLTELIYKLREEKITLETELRLKLESEIEGRVRAEGSLREITAERDRLAAENTRLIELSRRSAEELEREVELHRVEREKLTAEIDSYLRAQEREKNRLAEAAIAEMEERRRREEEARLAEAERIRLTEEREKRLEEERIAAEREAERERIQRETELREKKISEQLANTTYTTYVATLVFRRSVDPNYITEIGSIIKKTVAENDKEYLKIKVRATMPDNMTVRLDFSNVPEEEHELIVNIVKAIGNSKIGVVRGILD